MLCSNFKNTPSNTSKTHQLYLVCLMYTTRNVKNSLCFQGELCAGTTFQSTAGAASWSVVVTLRLPGLVPSCLHRDLNHKFMLDCMLEALGAWIHCCSSRNSSSTLTPTKITNYKGSSYLKDQQVQQDVEGAWGWWRCAGRSLPLCHDEG